MKKNAPTKIGLSLLTLFMIVGLFTELLPRYSVHHSSMIIGTIAYVSMVVLAWFSNDTSRFTIKFLTLAVASFATFHIVSEILFLQSLTFLMITSVLGYAALAVFVLAIATKLMNLVSQGPLSSLIVNGLLTMSTILVYWHVASINVVQSSLVFFVPFTLLGLSTIIQFAYRLIFVKRLLQTNA